MKGRPCVAAEKRRSRNYFIYRNTKCCTLLIANIFLVVVFDKDVTLLKYYIFKIFFHNLELTI